MPLRLRALTVFAALVVAGCVGHVSSRERAVARAAPLVSPKPLPALDIPAPESSEEQLASPSRDDALISGMRSAVLQHGARSVGSTSLVLKVPLDGGLEAAFKPETHSHGDRFRGEIAAYRLARLLGIDNVQPATARAVKWPSLLAAAKDGGTRGKLLQNAVVHDDGTVSGAMIAWRRGLSRLPLEHEPLWTAWAEWLSQTPPRRTIDRRLPLRIGQPIAARAHLAPQISTMVLFDHLTGNRDRWSGHNVLVDVTQTRLVFLDNNLAFEPALDDHATQRRAYVLGRVQKVSRRLMTALRKLSKDDLRAAMGLDDQGRPLLAEARLDDVLRRRDEIVEHIDVLITRFGENAVLAFD